VSADAVTASAFRVDPHIGPAYALLHVARMARITGLPETEVRRLVAEATQGRALGFFGQPTVNDPALRLAIAAAQHRAGGTAGR
jgi:K+-transporting ATPase ATPase C chain